MSEMTAVRRCVWAIGAALLTASSVCGEALTVELEGLIEGSRLDRKVALSVMVIDGESGEALASYEASRPMIPASNMKVLTSGVALDVLGPDFVFETEIVVQREGTSRVIVRGSGDPALGDSELLALMDMGVEDFLGLLAGKIMEAGAGDVSEIVIDDRVLDREYVHPTWPRSQLNRRYCAEVSGVNFQRNVISIYTHPTSAGRPPRIEVEPESSWIEIGNEARTVDRGRQHTAWASRRHETNDITLHGDVRYASDPVEVTIHEPGLQFGRLLADRVRRMGGSPGEARLARADEDLSGGERVYMVRTPLSTVLERCNVDSQNLYAESLMKRIGHEVSGASGSWANGAAVSRMALIERLGAWAGGDVTFADGSGMSRENRVTTRTMARWLASLSDDERIGEAFVSSLALAAEEGTLAKRFTRMRPNHEVRAKTGYLSGVSALSGYVIDRDTGDRVIFSIISNDKPNSVPLRDVRTLEEKIVLMIDEWMGAREESRPGG